MRKTPNLLKRIRIYLGVAIQRKNARIMTCGNCEGSDIVPISNAISEPYNSSNIKADSMYVQFSICSTCGAVCKEIQLWNNSGNINELDDKIKTINEPINKA